MKKLTTLLFALLLATSVTFAQNSADIKQNGDENDATITQSGSNNAFIYQGTGFAFYPAASQDGISNNNSATIDQTGSFTAYIGQGINEGIATGSEATIIQSGAGGYADIFQGVFGSATDVQGKIAQNGSDNAAFIRQGQVGYAIGNSTKPIDATITQFGSQNFNSILQGFGSFSTSVNNTAKVTTAGQNNIGQILQGVKLSLAGPGRGAGFAKNNMATLIQRGDDNYANVIQGLNGASALNNIGLIKQFGDLNKAIINQAVGTGVSLTNSKASIIQNADHNLAEINQGGVNHSATIKQN